MQVVTYCRDVRLYNYSVHFNNYYLGNHLCCKTASPRLIRDIAFLHELAVDWCMFVTWLVFLYRMTSCTRSRASSYSSYRLLLNPTVQYFSCVTKILCNVFRERKLAFSMLLVFERKNVLEIKGQTFDMNQHRFSMLKLQNNLPGQGFVLHSPVSSLGPLQSNPPLAGEGLVQVLDRSQIPPPHVTLQERQLAHSLHEPLTVVVYKKKVGKNT